MLGHNQHTYNDLAFLRYVTPRNPFPIERRIAFTVCNTVAPAPLPARQAVLRQSGPRLACRPRGEDCGSQKVLAAAVPPELKVSTGRGAAGVHAHRQKNLLDSVDRKSGELDPP